MPFDWTPILKEECDKVGITYFSAPYDFDAIDMLDPFVPAYKIGSGDITWIEACLRMARKGKPVLLATGASTIGDVQRAVDAVVPVTLLRRAECTDIGIKEQYRIRYIGDIFLCTSLEFGTKTTKKGHKAPDEKSL